MNSQSNCAEQSGTERQAAPCELHPDFQVTYHELANAWICSQCEVVRNHEAAIAETRRQDEERRLAEARKASQLRREVELATRLGASGIPLRYRDRTFDTFPLPPADTSPGNAAMRLGVNTLRSYANRFPAMREKGISVLLVGGCGTGKTGLACSVANVVVRQHGFTAAFMSAYAAVRHQRDTWGRKGKTEREALDDLLLPDLLVLDEVGSSVGADSEISMLFEVLNGRYEQQRPTMLLSNLPMDDYEADGRKRIGLRTYLGPRICDRFRDDGSFTLAMDWPSLRGARGPQ